MRTSIVARLREAGASFAYLFGSQAEGRAGPTSDIDVAAWFGRRAEPIAATHGLPDTVDLVVLDTAGLEIAGRVAMYGRLLFEDDQVARVRWEATTRKIYADERPRIDQARRDFVTGAVARGRR